jgi:hypothetical protein
LLIGGNRPILVPGMFPILIGSANVAVLIICLMGLQCCYFRKSWKWFWLMLVCVLLSAASASFEIYQWLGAQAQNSAQGLDRSLVNPL